MGDNGAWTTLFVLAGLGFVAALAGIGWGLYELIAWAV
jgi:hypothetical protein